MIPRSLRERLYLTALLLILAACFPIQRQVTHDYNGPLQQWHAVELRQLTFFWQPLATLKAYSFREESSSERVGLDWESCALELVVIVSLGLIYLCWLDSRIARKRNQAEKGNTRGAVELEMWRRWRRSRYRRPSKATTGCVAG
jgi:hypothetical protein